METEQWISSEIFSALENNSEGDKVVTVAGLDFNTDIQVITEALCNFGTNPFQTGLGLHFRDESERGWEMGFGGWVMGCPKAGDEESREEPIFVGRLEGLDSKSMEMVPKQWWLKRGNGSESEMWYRPELDLDQQNVQAVRRSTAESGFLCLWIGRLDQDEHEVVILKDASGQCGSHRNSFEASGSIADVCK